MLLHWILSTAALPCAGLVHADDHTAESDAAQVIVEVGNDDVTVHYLVTYEGDAPGVGWIIPVFGELAAVGDGDRDLFDTLAFESRPAIDEAPEATCLCSPSDDLAKGGTNGNVEIVAEGYTGTYEWVALASDDVVALEEWLGDRDFVPPDTADLDHYIALDATFLAVTTRPTDAETPEEGREMPPFAVTTDGFGGLRIPTVMARGASAPSQRSTVYVLGTSRATLESGWSVVDLPEVTGPAGADGFAVLEDEIARLGASGSWARTFAGDTIDGFLTRFDLAAPRELHTDDAVFALEDATDEIRTTVVLGGGSLATTVWLPLLGLGILARRRRHAA